LASDRLLVPEEDPRGREVEVITLDLECHLDPLLILQEHWRNLVQF